MFLFDIAYSDYYHLDQKSMTGIVVGVCIALTCILICILILIYRSKARYVFVLEDWSLFQCTHSWDVPSPPRVLSSLKYSVSSPVSTSTGNKALCWLFLLYLSPFSNEKEEELTEWVSGGTLATKYEACFQLNPHFESDKHAAVLHLLFLLNPPACPHLACKALTPRVLLDKRNSDSFWRKEFHDADFKADPWCSFFAVVQATVCLSSAARGYKLAQWLCPKLWDQNKYRSLEIINLKARWKCFSVSRAF